MTSVSFHGDLIELKIQSFLALHLKSSGCPLASQPPTLLTQCLSYSGTIWLSASCVCYASEQFFSHGLQGTKCRTAYRSQHICWSLIPIGVAWQHNHQEILPGHSPHCKVISETSLMLRPRDKQLCCLGNAPPLLKVRRSQPVSLNPLLHIRYLHCNS